MNQVRVREVVGPGLRKLLVLVLVLFAILVVDSIYLGAITFVQWLQGTNLEGELYQGAFLIHLALGFLLIVPAIVFAGAHLARAIDRQTAHARVAQRARVVRSRSGRHARGSARATRATRWPRAS